MIVLSIQGLYRCGKEFLWVHWSYICWEDNNTVTAARGMFELLLVLKVLPSYKYQMHGKQTDSDRKWAYY